jgi:aryl-alcohol dehydrogenase-like predicted oxidoreductase
MEFVRLARDKKLTRVVSIQNAYNLLNRTFEMGLAEVHRHLDVLVLAYSRLGFGHLSGTYLNGAIPEGARLTRFPTFGPRYAKRNAPEATAAYVELTRRSGLSPATMAIAFVRSRWFIASTIIGARTLEQVRDNVAAAQVTLAPGGPGGPRRDPPALPEPRTLRAGRAGFPGKERASI